ncbi:hypothetical protein ACLKA6_016490 [Drosophila palustris]
MPLAHAVAHIKWRREQQQPQQPHVAPTYVSALDSMEPWKLHVNASRPVELSSNDKGQSAKLTPAANVASGADDDDAGGGGGGDGGDGGGGGVLAAGGKFRSQG